MGTGSGLHDHRWHSLPGVSVADLILDRKGFSLTYEGECLIIRHKELTTRSLPMRRIGRIICQHGVNIDTKLIGQCQRFGIDFVVLNQRYSEHSFAIHANHLRQAQRRVAQYRISTDPELAFNLSKRLVLHKILLSIHCTRSHADKALHQTLREQWHAAANAQRLDVLRGHEGIAQRIMFSHWKQQLRPELGFVRRERRPPPDPVNAVLSLSATLTHHEAVRQCLVHGLDPWLGFYHTLTPGRQSLACDLMEPLRPALEQWVVQQFNQGHLDLRHFSTANGGCMMGKQGREIFYRLWQKNMTIIQRRLRRYARLFSRHLQQIEETPPCSQAGIF
ncbi:CRISPR-associated endonuclease Cas1 [Lysobacteraceae bacterium NML71-0210]|nr:CRISPR-associated endonuclease Cas1 [Xanthomonadaceae bacterium NML71-0210]